MANTAVERVAHINPRLLAAGPAGEAIAGAIAILLGIIGFLGGAPVTLAGVGTLTIGTTLFWEGLAVASRRAQWAALSPRERMDASTGLSIEFVGGAVTILLGVLSLAGVVSSVMLPVGALVFGTSLVVASVTNGRVNHAFRSPGVSTSAAAELLSGMGSMLLGLLALIVPDSWLALSLLAILAAGFAVLLSGVAAKQLFRF